MGDTLERLEGLLLGTDCRYRNYLGIMENSMETTIIFCRDNGKENGNCGDYGDYWALPCSWLC